MTEKFTGNGMKRLKVRTQLSFGRTDIYPDEEEALLFCDLLGRRAFMPKDIPLLTHFGFELYEVMKDGKERIIHAEFNAEGRRWARRSDPSRKT